MMTNTKGCDNEETSVLTFSNLISLVFKTQERHDILDWTIGHLDEEQEPLGNGLVST